MKHLRLKKNKPKLETVTVKNQTKVINVNPIYSTSGRFKKQINQDKNQPFTLADLCDANYGKLRNIRIDGAPLTNLTVLVVACRSLAQSTNSTDSMDSEHPLNSPTPHDYETASDSVPSRTHEMEDLPYAWGDSPTWRGHAATSAAAGAAGAAADAPSWHGLPPWQAADGLPPWQAADGLPPWHQGFDGQFFNAHDEAVYQTPVGNDAFYAFDGGKRKQPKTPQRRNATKKKRRKS